MKPTALIIALAALAVCGCESLSDATSTVREKFSTRVDSRAKAFAAPPRVAYEAVRAAAAQMGYRIIRGGAAQGELEAVSGVGEGDTSRSARQLAMKVHLHATLDGQGTDVTIRLTEIIEADSANHAGMATETPLRDTPQYEVFFRDVQHALDVQAGAKKE
jgi:hypothetical protein